MADMCWLPVTGFRLQCPLCSTFKEATLIEITYPVGSDSFPDVGLYYLDRHRNGIDCTRMANCVHLCHEAVMFLCPQRIEKAITMLLMSIYGDIY